MVVTIWLIDKSASVRLHRAADADEWANRIERGLVRIATVTRLEIGCSARSTPASLAARCHADLVHARRVPDPKIEGSGLELQSGLAERGQHRAPSVPDPLIAATAELTDLTVLYVDTDFDLIADVNRQPIERLGAT